jgi:hypothetical protein
MLSFLLERNGCVRLPSRLNRVLDRVADNDVSPKVDAFDENALLAGSRKVANRITLGLVLAAAVGGMLFVYQILRHDRRQF